MRLVRPLVFRSLLLGCCFIGVASADEVKEDSVPEQPDIALLEFLGEWDGESEAWLETQKLESISEETEVKAGAEAEVNDE